MNSVDDSAFSESEISPVPSPAVPGGAVPEADPFAAENFADASGPVDQTEDLTISLRTPNDEEFVRVSEDPRHHVKASMLVVDREEGFGKSYFLLTPSMRLWAGNQPSLAKLVKKIHLFLFINHDGEYGVWPARDAFDNWATSELQVVGCAKKQWTRRYTLGKVRKAYTSASVDMPVTFPDKPMTGSDGILAQVLGKDFVVTGTDCPAMKRLMR